MTNKSKQKNTQPSIINGSVVDVPKKNRRRLLKAAVAVVPVIMTLHSGTARAVSSNIYGESSRSEAKLTDDGQKLVCVEYVGSGPEGFNNYDLGDSPIMGRLGELDQNCNDVVGGIMISNNAYNSLTGRGVDIIIT